MNGKAKKHLGWGIALALCLACGAVTEAAPEESGRPVPNGPDLVPVDIDWNDSYNLCIGDADPNTPSFGWQFGHWSLEGVTGIRDDFARWFGGTDSPEFQAQWEAFCEAMGSDNPRYPPPMSRGAILFGGTDPGRFVPSYMVFHAGVRPDVFILTQNQLVDEIYMADLRRAYGTSVHIPSQDESVAAFRQYLEDLQAGLVPDTGAIKVENGRVTIEGVAGVMAINGILARMIFEENKAKHDFYVEESYPIQWMYPYLLPNGLMLRINAEPLVDLPVGIVENDRRFWDWYADWLRVQPGFAEDINIPLTFSKLRTAIAGVYEWHRMFDEAEYAYMQALELLPRAPETVFRLAQMLVNLGRLDEAESLLVDFCDKGPATGPADDTSAAEFLGRVRQLRVERDPTPGPATF